MLLEVFKRLPPPTDTIRCAAVCRRWRRILSSGARAGCLPIPPRHFGFFRNYHPSPLPPFVATESGVGVGLDVGGLLPRVVSKRGVDIVDGRGGLLVLRERSKKFWELNLVLCNPQQRSYRRLPPVNISGYDMACAAFVPLQGVGFRVAAVLFGGAEDLWRRYAVSGVELAAVQNHALMPSYPVIQPCGATNEKYRSGSTLSPSASSTPSSRTV